MSGKFDAKKWKAGAKKTFRANIRLIDGSDYEFEFKLLIGAPALELKRQVFALEKRTRELVKDQQADERDVETSVSLSEVDRDMLRLLTRACVDADMDNDDIDRLVLATGGLNGKFSEGLYRACGITHPKEALKLIKPDFFEDLPFLSPVKRGKTGG